MLRRATSHLHHTPEIRIELRAALLNDVAVDHLPLSTTKNAAAEAQSHERLLPVVCQEPGIRPIAGYSPGFERRESRREMDHFRLQRRNAVALIHGVKRLRFDFERSGRSFLCRNPLRSNCTGVG